MSETAADTVHEAYAFACMRCGYGWEQAYEIHHHVDASGHPHVVYTVDGQRVPSPLSTPTCANCGGHVVRIMRSGRVSTVQRMLGSPKAARTEEAVEDGAVPGAGPAPAAVAHHWQLSSLLRPFHRR
ncbi:hypothetical protein OG909_11855 [Streptomyces sp. NBC_01754]|uniref:hypothetical protein n=1 Tax=Streptomyces sp. NBC_01754 TaxID=2975930 RepID=UPI002DD90F9B|nr:hypothetical protein [Streptomyces sp. NBC_01754]WSC92932.1 hypothetical protein OG909_11855 [Streptomyces sp. NBC_01754]